MQEHIEQPDELLPSFPCEERPSPGAPPQINGTLPLPPTSKPSDHQTFFYMQDEDENVSEDDGPHGLSSPLAMPFQPSTPLPEMPQPAIGTTPAPSDGFPASPVSKSPAGRGFPVAKVLVLVGMVVLTFVVGSLVVFAQPAPSVPAHRTQQLSRAVTVPPSQGGKPQVAPSPSLQGNQVWGPQPPLIFLLSLLSISLAGP